jgi:hypothetical protein
VTATTTRSSAVPVIVQRPYGLARQASALRRRGSFLAALEIRLQLGWDGRCIYCGHRLSREDSRLAGVGPACRRAAG